MRIAYLDCFSGISGDMFLGALVDAGVSARVLEETVAALNIGARLEISRVDRSGITATKVDVYAGEEDEREHNKDRPREAVAHGHSHGHGEEHGHEHFREHDGSRAGAPAPHLHEPHLHGRGLTEIRAIINAAGIGESAKTTAIAIFKALGVAEARIHNRDIETFIFTKWARWMRWWISFAPRSGLRRWGW